MPQIEHMALYADGDPGPLKDFYVRAFGLRVIVDNHHTDPPGYFLAGDGGGGMALEIIGRPAGTANADQRYVCHLAILVPDVATQRAELERLGLTFETDTAVHNESMTTCFCRDPAGNRIQVVSRTRPLGS